MQKLSLRSRLLRAACSGLLLAGLAAVPCATPYMSVAEASNMSRIEGHSYFRGDLNCPVYTAGNHAGSYLDVSSAVLRTNNEQETVIEALSYGFTFGGGEAEATPNVLLKYDKASKSYYLIRDDWTKKWYLMTGSEGKRAANAFRLACQQLGLADYDAAPVRATLGGLSMSMTMDQVRSIYGEPTKSFKQRDAKQDETDTVWIYGSSVEIHFTPGGYLEELKTTANNGFKAAGQVAVGMSTAAIQPVYGGYQCREHTDKDGTTHYTYTMTKYTGITFTVKNDKITSITLHEFII